MQNAYFQLVNKEDGTWLKLFPAVDGGETLVFSEVSEYLESHKISCDTTELYQLMDSQSHEQSMRLCMQPVRPERESYSLSLEKDGLEAVVRFYAPTEGAELLTKDEFMKDLQYRRIVNGIDESVIDAFFADRKYCTDYVVARGCLPEEGKSAVVEYFFNTDPKAKPTVNEDGSVDFFHLNTINHCEAGELLAKLVPAVPGKPGKDVTGKVILPREVKTTKLHYGRRIRFEKAEDGTEAIYSEVNGHVSLVGNDVFVSDVLEVENVDISTGNIDYNGSVQVNGNVCSNFSVRAKGNVDIHGVVEGAAVEAGGNIIIVRGMNGMGKGVLKAGGNVVAKFLESATVETVVLLSHKKADSYIHIDVEFGEGEGKIPVDSIAKRAEAYKPKEKVTYKMIKEYIEAKYGFKVHTAYIAEVKRDLGLPMYDAPNAVEELKQPRKHPTPEKVEAIKDALRYFAVI